MRDAVVIGAGLAGLAATLRLAERGRAVTLVTGGLGGLQLGQGTIDVLGYDGDRRVEDPLAAVDSWTGDDPDHADHPYARFSGEQVREALAWLAGVAGPDLLEAPEGLTVANVCLPTAVGALRPTALIPPSMRAGVIRSDREYVFVGLRRLKDFYPDLVAGNLQRQSAPDAGADGAPIRARAVWVDVEARPGEVDTSGVNWARALDRPEARERLCRAIVPQLRDGEVVGLPAVLGLADTGAWRDIAARLGHDVFEVPLPPPSVPGMRLNERLTELARRRARYVLGSRVTGIEGLGGEGGRGLSVRVATAGHDTLIEARDVILASGGLESGALWLDSYGHVTETALGLPVRLPEGVAEDGEGLTAGDYWGADQPLYRTGLAVDDQMRVLDGGGALVDAHVRAAGGILAGATRWHEKSGDGIALASALRAADSILEGEE
jgi:glycerol-3-phosphate dehydrogenase subunit B